MTKYMNYRTAVFNIIDALPDAISTYVKVERDAVLIGYKGKIITILKDEKLTQVGIDSYVRLLIEV